MTSPAPTEETGRHLAYLDGWRGLAILLVLLGHFGLDERLPGLSVLGVDLFFVLSGRLMAEILFVRQSPLPKFFKRRFSRVYPGLAVFVLSAFLLFRWTPYHQGPLAAATALTFTINYAMIFGHKVALYDHLWSLAVEEHSYILLAVLALIARRLRRGPGLAILGVGALALVNGVVQRDVLHHDYFDVFWRTDVALAPIFLAAYARLHQSALSDRIHGWFWLAVLAGAILVKLFTGYALFAFAVGSALLVVAIATIDRAPAAVLRALQLRPLVLIGQWSFSIYLWQQPFYKLARDHPNLTPALVAGALIAGLASFYLVENPARRWLNSRLT